MTQITHAKVSAKVDGPDTTQVRPSDWNADHVVDVDAADVAYDNGSSGLSSTTVQDAVDEVAALSGSLGNIAYLGGLPSGTLARSYSFTSTVESWTTSAGTLSSTGGKLRLTHTSPAVAIEPSGAANVADGEFVFDFDSTSMPGSGGPLFRVTDASNWYGLIMETTAGPTLYKRVAGSLTQLLVVTVPFALRSSATGPFRGLVRFVGTLIEIYVNGTLILAFRDSTFSTGRVGLWADNATVELDNIRVFTSPVTTGNVVVV